MKLLLIAALQLLICATGFAQGKDTDDKSTPSSRPSVFPEIDQARVFCMRDCAIDLPDFMGVKILCENFERAAYARTCGSGERAAAIEYCNCTRGECARFHVNCLGNGDVCHVKMLPGLVDSSSCSCNGRTCEHLAMQSKLSSCVMRLDVASAHCRLDALGSETDGRALYTACEGNVGCESSTVQTAVINAQPDTREKPGEPK